MHDGIPNDSAYRPAMGVCWTRGGGGGQQGWWPCTSSGGPPYRPALRPRLPQGKRSREVVVCKSQAAEVAQALWRDPRPEDAARLAHHCAHAACCTAVVQNRGVEALLGVLRTGNGQVRVPGRSFSV